MKYVKEPEGVDFVIKSRPLTKKDREEISEVIRKHKAQEAAKKDRSKRKAS